MTSSLPDPGGGREAGGTPEGPFVPPGGRAIPDAPPPEIRFHRALRLGPALVALWRSRSIVVSLAQREIRSTYNQAVLGVAWALLAPFTLMVVFTVFFDRVGHIDTGGVPYPLFSYLGLLPWTFFSNSVSSSGTSLINNPLLNKVYAPREVFPLAEVATAVVSLACASVALAVLFVVEAVVPSSTSYWVLVLLPIMFAFATAVALLVSSITVYLRDLRHALPLLMQLGLFLTPVLYSLQVIPSEWRGVYVAVNPLGGVIDGLRRCVLHGQAPNGWYTLIAAVSSAVWVLGAYLLFKRLETGFADVS